MGFFSGLKKLWGKISHPRKKRYSHKPSRPRVNTHKLNSSLQHTMNHAVAHARQQASIRKTFHDAANRIKQVAQQQPAYSPSKSASNTGKKFADRMGAGFQPHIKKGTPYYKYHYEQNEHKDDKKKHTSIPEKYKPFDYDKYVEEQKKSAKKHGYDKGFKLLGEMFSGSPVRAMKDAADAFVDESREAWIKAKEFASNTEDKVRRGVRDSKDAIIGAVNSGVKAYDKFLWNQQTKDYERDPFELETLKKAGMVGARPQFNLKQAGLPWGSSAKPFWFTSAIDNIKLRNKISARLSFQRASDIVWGKIKANDYQYYKAVEYLLFVRGNDYRNEVNGGEAKNPTVIAGELTDKYFGEDSRYFERSGMTPQQFIEFYKSSVNTRKVWDADKKQYVFADYTRADTPFLPAILGDDYSKMDKLAWRLVFTTGAIQGTLDRERGEEQRKLYEYNKNYGYMMADPDDEKHPNSLYNFAQELSSNTIKVITSLGKSIGKKGYYDKSFKKDMAAVKKRYSAIFKGLGSHLKNHYYAPLKEGQFRIFGENVCNESEAFDYISKVPKYIASRNMQVGGHTSGLKHQVTWWSHSISRKDQERLMKLGAYDLLVGKTTGGVVVKGSDKSITGGESDTLHRIRKAGLMDEYLALKKDYDKNFKKEAWDILFNKKTVTGAVDALLNHKRYDYESGNLLSDIAHEILLDPTSWVSLGVGSMAKNASKEFAQAAGRSAQKAVKDAAKKTVSKGLFDNALKNANLALRANPVIKRPPSVKGAKVTFPKNFNIAAFNASSTKSIADWRYSKIFKRNLEKDILTKPVKVSLQHVDDYVSRLTRINIIPKEDVKNIRNELNEMVRTYRAQKASQFTYSLHHITNVTDFMDSVALNMSFFGVTIPAKFIKILRKSPLFIKGVVAKGEKQFKRAYDKFAETQDGYNKFYVDSRNGLLKNTAGDEVSELDVFKSFKKNIKLFVSKLETLDTLIVKQNLDLKEIDRRVSDLIQDFTNCSATSVTTLDGYLEDVAKDLEDMFGISETSLRGDIDLIHNRLSALDARVSKIMHEEISFHMGAFLASGLDNLDSIIKKCTQFKDYLSRRYSNYFSYSNFFRIEGIEKPSLLFKYDTILGLRRAAKSLKQYLDDFHAGLEGTLEQRNAAFAQSFDNSKDALFNFMLDNLEIKGFDPNRNKDLADTLKFFEEETYEKLTPEQKQFCDIFKNFKAEYDKIVFLKLELDYDINSSIKDGASKLKKDEQEHYESVYNPSDNPYHYEISEECSKILEYLRAKKELVQQSNVVQSQAESTKVQHMYSPSKYADSSFGTPHSEEAPIFIQERVNNLISDLTDFANASSDLLKNGSLKELDESLTALIKKHTNSDASTFLELRPYLNEPEQRALKNIQSNIEAKIWLAVNDELTEVFKVFDEIDMRNFVKLKEYSTNLSIYIDDVLSRLNSFHSFRFSQRLSRDLSSINSSFIKGFTTNIDKLCASSAFYKTNGKIRYTSSRILEGFKSSYYMYGHEKPKMKDYKTAYTDFIEELVQEIGGLTRKPSLALIDGVEELVGVIFEHLRSIKFAGSKKLDGIKEFLEHFDDYGITSMADVLFKYIPQFDATLRLKLLTKFRHSDLSVVLRGTDKKEVFRNISEEMFKKSKHRFQSRKVINQKEVTLWNRIGRILDTSKKLYYRDGGAFYEAPDFDVLAKDNNLSLDSRIMQDYIYDTFSSVDNVTNANVLFTLKRKLDELESKGHVFTEQEKEIYDELSEVLDSLSLLNNAQKYMNGLANKAHEDRALRNFEDITDVYDISESNVSVGPLDHILKQDMFVKDDKYSLENYYDHLKYLDSLNMLDAKQTEMLSELDEMSLLKSGTDAQREQYNSKLKYFKNKYGHEFEYSTGKLTMAKSYCYRNFETEEEFISYLKRLTTLKKADALTYLELKDYNYLKQVYSFKESDPEAYESIITTLCKENTEMFRLYFLLGSNPELTKDILELFKLNSLGYYGIINFKNLLDTDKVHSIKMGDNEIPLNKEGVQIGMFEDLPDTQLYPIFKVYFAEQTKATHFRYASLETRYAYAPNIGSLELMPTDFRLNLIKLSEKKANFEKISNELSTELAQKDRTEYLVNRLAKKQTVSPEVTPFKSVWNYLHTVSNRFKATELGESSFKESYDTPFGSVDYSNPTSFDFSFSDPKLLQYLDPYILLERVDDALYLFNLNFLKPDKSLSDEAAVFRQLSKELHNMLGAKSSSYDRDLIKIHKDIYTTFNDWFYTSSFQDLLSNLRNFFSESNLEDNLKDLFKNSENPIRDYTGRLMDSGYNVMYNKPEIESVVKRFFRRFSRVTDTIKFLDSFNYFRSNLKTSGFSDDKIDIICDTLFGYSNLSTRYLKSKDSAAMAGIIQKIMSNTNSLQGKEKVSLDSFRRDMIKFGGDSVYVERFAEEVADPEIQKRLIDLSRNGHIDPMNDVKIQMLASFVYNPSFLEEMTEVSKQHPVIFADLETTGLNEQEKEITSIACKYFEPEYFEALDEVNLKSFLDYLDRDSDLDFQSHISVPRAYLEKNVDPTVYDLGIEPDDLEPGYTSVDRYMERYATENEDEYFNTRDLLDSFMGYLDEHFSKAWSNDKLVDDHTPALVFHNFNGFDMRFLKSNALRLGVFSSRMQSLNSLEQHQYNSLFRLIKLKNGENILFTPKQQDILKDQIMTLSRNMLSTTGKQLPLRKISPRTLFELLDDLSVSLVKLRDIKGKTDDVPIVPSAVTLDPVSSGIEILLKNSEEFDDFRSELLTLQDRLVYRLQQLPTGSYQVNKYQTEEYLKSNKLANYMKESAELNNQSYPKEGYNVVLRNKDLRNYTTFALSKESLTYDEAEYLGSVLKQIHSKKIYKLKSTSFTEKYDKFFKIMINNIIEGAKRSSSTKYRVLQYLRVPDDSASRFILARYLWDNIYKFNPKNSDVGSILYKTPSSDYFHHLSDSEQYMQYYNLNREYKDYFDVLQDTPGSKMFDPAFEGFLFQNRDLYTFIKEADLEMLSLKEDGEIFRMLEGKYDHLIFRDIAPKKYSDKFRVKRNYLKSLSEASALKEAVKQRIEAKVDAVGFLKGERAAQESSKSAKKEVLTNFDSKLYDTFDLVTQLEEAVFRSNVKDLDDIVIDNPLFKHVRDVLEVLEQHRGRLTMEQRLEYFISGETVRECEQRLCADLLHKSHGIIVIPMEMEPEYETLLQRFIKTASNMEKKHINIVNPNGSGYLYITLKKGTDVRVLNDGHFSKEPVLYGFADEPKIMYRAPEYKPVKLLKYDEILKQANPSGEGTVYDALNDYLKTLSDFERDSLLITHDPLPASYVSDYQDSVKTIVDNIISLFDDMNSITKGAIAGSNNILHSLNFHQRLYKNLPTVVKENSLDFDMQCDQRLWHTGSVDYSIMGSKKYALKFSDVAESDLLFNMYSMSEEASKIVEADEAAIDFFFDKNNFLRLNNFAADMDYKDFSSFQKNNTDQIVVLVTASKHTESGYELIEHEVKDEASFEYAKAAGGVLMGYDTYVEIAQEINQATFKQPVLKFLSKLMVFYKTGQLANPGTWIKNWFDGVSKIYAETGELGNTLYYNMKAIKVKTQFNKIRDIIERQQLGGYISEVQIKRDWNLITKEAGVDWSYSDFMSLRYFFDNKGISGGQSGLLKSIFKENEKRNKRNLAVKPNIKGNSLKEVLYKNTPEPLGDVFTRFHGLDYDEISEIVNKLPDRLFESHGISKESFLKIFSEESYSNLSKKQYYEYSALVGDVLDTRLKKIDKGRTFTSRLRSATDSVLNVVFKPMSLVEEQLRLGMFLQLRDKYTRSEIFKKITDTQFNYDLKTFKHKLIELVVPYYNYERCNFKYWIRVLKENPRFIHNIENVIAPLTWDSQYVDYDERLNNMGYQFNMLAGNVILGDTGYTLKTGLSIMSVFNLLYGGPNALIGKLAVPLQGLSKLLLQHCCSDFKWIMNSVDFSLLEKDGIEQLFTELPILSQAFDIYSRVTNRSGKEKWATEDLSPAEVALLRYQESMVGYVAPYENFYDNAATNFEEFLANLEKQGLWWDSNNHRIRDIKYKNIRGLNGDFNLVDDEGNFVQSEWDRLVRNKWMYNYEVWDANQKKFVKFPNRIFGGLNDPNLSWDDCARLHMELFGEKYDQNQGRFVDKEHYLPGGLNKHYNNFMDYAILRKAIKGEEWVGGKGGKFVKTDSPIVNNLLLKALNRPHKDTVPGSISALMWKAYNKILVTMRDKAPFKDKYGRYVLTGNPKHDDKVYKYILKNERDIVPNKGWGWRNFGWRHWGWRNFHWRNFHWINFGNNWIDYEGQKNLKLAQKNRPYRNIVNGKGRAFSYTYNYNSNAGIRMAGTGYKAYDDFYKYSYRYNYRSRAINPRYNINTRRFSRRDHRLQTGDKLHDYTK